MSTSTTTLSAASSGALVSGEPSERTVAPDTFTDAELGAQLTAEYKKAVGGLKAVLVFGAMMANAEKVVLTRETNSRGPQTKGEGLKGWIAQNAPDVNYKTAHRFMTLANGLRDEFHLNAKVDLVHLLTAPTEDLPAAQKKTREKIDAFVEGKSQRQLMFEFGYSSGAKKGGAREKKQTPPTPDELHAAEIAEAVEAYESILRQLDAFIAENQHTLIEKDQRTTLAAALGETKRKVESVK